MLSRHCGRRCDNSVWQVKATNSAFPCQPSLTHRQFRQAVRQVYYLGTGPFICGHIQEARIPCSLPNRNHKSSRQGYTRHVPFIKQPVDSSLQKHQRETRWHRNRLARDTHRTAETTTARRQKQSRSSSQKSTSMRRSQQATIPPRARR